MNFGTSQDFNNILSNDYVAAVLAIFIIAYGLILSRVGLPRWLRDLFNNNIFRVVFLSLLLIHNFNRTPHVAVVIALVFVLTVYFINLYETEEKIREIEKFIN